MLSDEERASRRFDRMLAKAKQYRVSTYLSKTAGDFQRMIRAEAGASRKPYATAVVNGELAEVHRKFSQCVCVTCGQVGPWSGGLAGMHTGHFLASRRASIVLEEANVAPQCSRCNRYESGKPLEFRIWMRAMRPDDIERLEHLKRNVIRKWSLEELVDLRIEYLDRIKKTGLQK